MDAVLQRIEALSGDGRYAVSFRRPDGSEQTAVFHAAAANVSVAEASLPEGWTLESEPFRATAQAVLAVENARSIGPLGAPLTDVDGGWDVSMGNVVLSDDEVPDCTAHGQMQPLGESVYECAECGARARVRRR